MRLQAARELLKDTVVAVGASATNTVISNEFAATGAHSRAGLRIGIEYTAVVAAGITAKLQMGISNAATVDAAGSAVVTWIDVGGTRGQAALVANASPAYAFILMHPGVALDAAQLPLTNKLRVVVSTGAGDSASIKMVTVFEEELDARLQGALRSH